MNNPRQSVEKNPIQPRNYTDCLNTSPFTHMLEKYLLAVGLVRSIPSHTIFSSKGTIIATEAKQIKNLYAVCCMLYQYHHDDVIKWKHFPRNWPFVREIHRSPVNFPHKGQWRGALMFSLIYAWINDWVNNREAGDLRRQHGHYDVIVMTYATTFWYCFHAFNANMNFYSHVSDVCSLGSSWQ